MTIADFTIESLEFAVGDKLELNDEIAKITEGKEYFWVSNHAGNVLCAVNKMLVTIVNFVQ
jgi:hypothetical protein